MAAGNPTHERGAAWPVFPVACWGLGLMAFTQLLVAGMALATRFEESRVVRVVEKEVLKPVVVRVPAPAPVPSPQPGASVVSRPPVSAEPVQPALAPTPLAVPGIADPRSERLVTEARQARVAGDMGKAVMQLEEALKQSPDDPSVHWEMGMVHEQMGVFDRAADHYQKILDIGLPDAGSLYELAGAKLRDGFEQPADMLGKLSLGRVRIFKNPNHEKGELVILTIPVQKGAAEEIDLDKLDVSVLFFNRTTKGEIVVRDDKTEVSQQWVTLPFDWAGGEESLRMNYLIPPLDMQTEHLFGGRSYYGQVVSLIYKGEVLDVQAWPRDLAARIPQQPSAPAEMQMPEFQNELPPDFDPEVPILPSKVPEPLPVPLPE